MINQIFAIWITQYLGAGFLEGLTGLFLVIVIAFIFNDAFQ